jgi:hypothetical protein
LWLAEHVDVTERLHSNVYDWWKMQPSESTYHAIEVRKICNTNEGLRATLMGYV